MFVRRVNIMFDGVVVMALVTSTKPGFFFSRLSGPLSLAVPLWVGAIGRRFLPVKGAAS